MPFGDRTGPFGQGPMSGRGAGYCGGYGAPGYMNPPPGSGAWPYAAAGWFGRGGGRGGGRGHRNWYRATGLTGWQRAEMGWPGPYGVDASMPPYGSYEPTKEQELAALRSQVQYMEESIKQAQERIQELEQKRPEE
jgi:hypothetical protein